MFCWETADLKTQVDDLLEQTLPLYRKIHAYVRYFLSKKYPSVMPKDGTIPAHLLGNMWAQQWSSILGTITELNPHHDVQLINSEVNYKLKVCVCVCVYILSSIQHLVKDLIFFYRTGP